MENGTRVLVSNTTDLSIDGLECKIVGKVDNLTYMFVIKRVDGELFSNGYETICMPSPCLLVQS